MKRRNFLASLGLVAGVSAVAKNDKQSDSFIRVEGREVMRITSNGNIISTRKKNICLEAEMHYAITNRVGVIGNTPS